MDDLPEEWQVDQEEDSSASQSVWVIRIISLFLLLVFLLPLLHNLIQLLIGRFGLLSGETAPTEPFFFRIITF